jgi:AraC-like DNA-binding protein
MDIRTSTLITGGLYTCTPAWTKMDAHFTDCHRLYFPRSGQAEFLYRDRAWKLEPRRIYMLPGYTWIRFRCKRRMVVDWLHFRPDSLHLDAELTRRAAGVRWPVAHWARWKSVYTRMEELFASRPAGLVCEVQAMLLWMFAELLRQPVSRERQNGERLPSFEQLQPALDFMDRRVAENPPLDEIAASVHLSPVYFHRCFTAAFHTTPHTYLARKRMQRAWELLRYEGLAVSETAERLNFSNPFYFSRAFRRFYGVKPIDVKRRVSIPQP